MTLLVALVLLILILWLLGVGHYVHISASLPHAGGMHTILIVVLVLALFVLLLRRF